ncbi:CAP domain-containing protein [Nocardia sp. NBC_01499]|uniref:CAP domain-containing protein n=1 Tax=Nocardia sp. NBC_01499 TaxID=2903597 RepID=UPI0038681C85
MTIFAATSCLIAMTATAGAVSAQDEYVNCADTGFINGMLNAHNQLRAQRGIHPLVLSEDLTTYAGTRARQLVTHFVHRGRYVENIYHGQTTTPAMVVDYWAQEPPHLSQMVLPRATHMGVGCVAVETGAPTSYVVVNYQP